MSKKPILNSPGWSESSRSRLESLIRAGAGRNLPVVFDFDNTIVCGDIGEATLAWLTREGILSSQHISETVAPPFVLARGETVSLSSVADITEYYESLLNPTIHGAKDPTPFANGYVWAVEVMEGLYLSQVVQATREVMAEANGQPGTRLEVTPGKTSYPIPWFYPETVELIAALIRYQYDPWIVSASNAWSVRWMVQHGLNPLLQSFGLGLGIPLQQVLGVTTLMRDRRGRLHKDAVLIRENPGYVSLRGPVLKSMQLTRFLQFPVPTYAGKVGVIWDYLGRSPYLAAGDSAGDLAMLSMSKHRLWIARLEKPDYQQTALSSINQTGEKGWIIQPVLSRSSPGFLPDKTGLQQRLPQLTPAIRQSLSLLSRFGLHWFS